MGGKCLQRKVLAAAAAALVGDLTWLTVWEGTLYWKDTQLFIILGSSMNQQQTSELNPLMLLYLRVPLEIVVWMQDTITWKLRIISQNTLREL